jgi:hypothetical protein
MVGVDKCKVYNQNDLSEEFRSKNREILLENQGAGLWVWKPYIILEHLKSMNMGDVLIYADAGVVATKEISSLVDFCSSTERGMCAFSIGKPELNRLYAKRQVFIDLECDETKCWDSAHASSSILVLTKSAFVEYLIQEWLGYVQKKSLVDNTLSRAELPGFRYHLHDQSILSVLLAKKNITIFRNPSQYGGEIAEGHDDPIHPYPTTFVHDRYKG